MSSGRVQLSAIGLQDEYLTGTPDVTYFVKKFTRHTKFALEILDIPFYQTNIVFGSWVNVVIPRNGQLIRTIYVKLVLPALSVGGYTNGIGNAIIKHADLVIGGQTIERINGEYMQIYDQTFISDSQQTALTYMVGTTTDGLGSLGPASAYVPGTQEPVYGFYPRTFIVPLSFYFMKNEALSIPLCALTRSEVEIRIQFKTLQDVVAGGYVTSNVISTTSLNWSIPPDYTPSPPPGFITGPVNVSARDILNTVTWLPDSALFSCIPDTSYSNIYYYNYNTQLFDAFVNFIVPFAGYITDVSQNNAGVTIVVSGSDSSNASTGSPTVYRSELSLVGLTNQFIELDDAVSGNPVNYVAIASDGINFLAIGNYSMNPSTCTVVCFLNPDFQAISYGVSITAQLISVTWAPGLQAYVIGDSTGAMYTYIIGASVLNKIVGTIGPYSAYSTTYGQIYSTSPLVCSNTVISNTYASSFDGGVTWSYTVPTSGPGNTAPSSISYSPSLNEFFVIINAGVSFSAYSIGIPVNTVNPTYPTELSPFQASLPVEYVFLADEETKYIQGAKIDYVITQLQMASTVVPAGATQLSGYKLFFINPVKELYFIIQDSNVITTNDYYNYYNTSTNSQQLVNLELQFNGEDIISPTVADALYLGKVQFMNNHTRLPNLQIYNYSFAIDPENYLPTGQVNMSRIMNQNIWINLTPNPNVRNIRVYARSYNILRVQNGLAGVLFIDNNFI